MKFLKNNIQIIMLLLVFVLALVFLFYQHQKIQNDTGFDITNKAVAENNYKICDSITDKQDYLWCVDSTIDNWTKELSAGNCAVFSDQSKRDQCSFGVAERTENSNLCPTITDKYLKRRCYSIFQEELLRSNASSYIYIDLGISFLVIIASVLFILFFLIRSDKQKRLSVLKIGTLLGFLLGVLMTIYSNDHYLSAITYHVDILQRIVCPPNNNVCQSNGAIPFPTFRGWFDSLLFIPILYACLGLLSGLIYKKISDSF